MQRGLEMYLRQQGYDDGRVLRSGEAAEVINIIIKGSSDAVLFDGWTDVDESRLYGRSIRVPWTARYARYIIANCPAWEGARAYNPLSVMHNDHSTTHLLIGAMCEENGIYRFTFDHADLHEVRACHGPVYFLERSSPAPRSRLR